MILEKPNNKVEILPLEAKLEARVAKFISLICNVSVMKQQMMEIGYNAEKLPLGKLSRATILKTIDDITKIDSDNFMSNFDEVILKGDCHRVSIDESIKPIAILPIQAADHKIVGDDHGSFIAWPKNLVIPDSKELQPTSVQHNEKQKPKKVKNYATADQEPKHTRSNVNKIINSNVFEKLL